MEKFTKGEWVAFTRDGDIKKAIIYLNGGEFEISNCPDCIPNAHLIAAAPEMYKMLNSIRQCLDWGYTNAELVDNINEYNEKLSALLSKARGEK